MQNTSSLAKELAKDCRSMDDIHEKLKELFKETIQQIFEAEMDEHLGYAKHEYSCAIRPALSPYPGTNPVTSGQDSCHIRPRFLRHSATVPALSGQ